MELISISRKKKMKNVQLLKSACLCKLVGRYKHRYALMTPYPSKIGLDHYGLMMLPLNLISCIATAILSPSRTSPSVKLRCSTYEHVKNDFIRLYIGQTKASTPPWV